MSNFATSSQLPNSPEVTVVGGRPIALPEGSLKSKASFASRADAVPDLEQGNGPIPPKRSSSVTSLKTFLSQDVDPNQSTFPLAAYCFMTGLVNAVTYSSVFVWAGFQTGNTVQLSMALARLFQGPVAERDYSFRVSDRMALTSLLAFLLGSFFARLGDRLGNKSRRWLMLGSFFQALLTMAAAICVWKNGQPSLADNRGSPSWTTVLGYVATGLLSCSLGVQSIMAKRLNTQFATSVVLTSVWCELVADPKLFHMRSWIVSRDHKMIAIFTLFLGGFLGRALLASIGSAATLGIGTGVRLIVAISFFFVPGALPK